MSLRRGRMANHDNIRTNLPQALHDLLITQAVSGGVDEINLKTMIEERPRQHQEPNRHLITERAVGNRRLKRGVNESDPHDVMPTSVHEERAVTILSM